MATDYRRINAAVRYEMFSVFQVKPGALGEDRAAVIVEAQTYLDGLADAGVTCGRTPWRRSRSATMSGSSRSRPRKCTESST